MRKSRTEDCISRPDHCSSCPPRVMIYMNANDMSSVYSTTRFVAAECRRLQLKPILTFDQLYMVEGSVSQSQRTKWQRIVLRCHVSWRIPHRYEFSWLHIGNVTTVSGLEDLLEIVVAIVFIPEVRGETGTDTGRLFFPPPSLIPFHCLPQQPSPPPPPHLSLTFSVPSHPRQISFHAVLSL